MSGLLSQLIHGPEILITRLLKNLQRVNHFSFIGHVMMKQEHFASIQIARHPSSPMNDSGLHEGYPYCPPACRCFTIAVARHGIPDSLCVRIFLCSWTTRPLTSLSQECTVSIVLICICLPKVAYPKGVGYFGQRATVVPHVHLIVANSLLPDPGT